VVKNLSDFAGYKLEIMAPARPDTVEDIISHITDETSCVVVQTPGFFGELHD